MPTGAYLSGRHYFFAHFLYDGLLFFQWVVRTRVLGLEDNLMTTDQKKIITEMRTRGCTYASIAETLSISESTIKTYCRRTRLTDNTEKTALVCKQCGKPIKVKNKHRARQFCSDQCRAAWWYANRGSKPRTEYQLICSNCSRPFVSIGNKARKYCSHQCYIAARFGGICRE